MSELSEAADVWNIHHRGQQFRARRGTQHDWMWQGIAAETWEPETFAAYSEFIPGVDLYLDIGAWIGPTVLFAAAIAPRVVAVEPDAVAMSQLLENLNLNPALSERVELFNMAVGAESGAITLHAYNFGESMTSIVPTRGARKMTFLAMGAGEFLDRVLGDARTCFIKVDIEGGEYEFVPELCRQLQARGVQADLFVSLHGGFFVSEDGPVSEVFANLARHGALLQTLASFGVVNTWGPDGWKPARELANVAGANHFMSTGGAETTLLIRGRQP